MVRANYNQVHALRGKLRALGNGIPELRVFDQIIERVLEIESRFAETGCVPDANDFDDLFNAVTDEVSAAVALLEETPQKRIHVATYYNHVGNYVVAFETKDEADQFCGKFSEAVQCMDPESEDIRDITNATFSLMTRGELDGLLVGQCDLLDQAPDLAIEDRPVP